MRSPRCCASSTSPTSRSIPGASYRGIHDSLVNYLGNTRPRMLLCLHEESAVALAHGYAKVTGRPMAAFVHSNVGLMHATMAIFNAWCDRAPVLVLGATGPMDATRRRPWIEWIHTARDQGALIRNFTKWDDQPASIGAAQEAILRAWMIANTAPQGPVYVNFDLALQEDEITELPPTPRPRPPRSAGRARALRPARAAGRRAARRRAASGDPCRARVARPCGVAAARGTRRGDRRPRDDRPQIGCHLPDRPSVARRRAPRRSSRPT